VTGKNIKKLTFNKLIINIDKYLIMLNFLCSKKSKIKANN
jgi:hypothetical protein